MFQVYLVMDRKPLWIGRFASGYRGHRLACKLAKQQLRPSIAARTIMLALKLGRPRRNGQEGNTK